MNDRRPLFVAAAALVTSPAIGLASSSRGWAAAAVLVAVQAGSVWWLTTRPRAVTAVVLVAGAALQVVVPSFGPGLIFVVLCTYAWLRPARESRWALGLAILAASGPALVASRWLLAGLWLAATLLAWSWGVLGRLAGERRAAEKRQVLLEERARIARELHDVLSHTVSVMVVQAAAADDVFEIDPVRARQAVRDTEQAGRQALAELRLFLRTVREDDAPGEPGPQPGLGDLPRLVSTMTSAGLAVTLVESGPGDDVPPGVQLSAYRIVQEALTNSLRHSGGAAVSVRVTVTPGTVEILVRDTAAGSPVPAAGSPLPGAGSALPAAGSVHRTVGSPLPDTGSRGHGLAGMRERAALLGGTLEAGPVDGGGFGVHATLPWAAA